MIIGSAVFIIFRTNITNSEKKAPTKVNCIINIVIVFI